MIFDVLNSTIIILLNRQLNILCRIGAPGHLITDRGTQFVKHYFIRTYVDVPGLAQRAYVCHYSPKLHGPVAALHVGGIESVAAVTELHHLAGRVAHCHVVVEHQVF